MKTHESVMSEIFFSGPVRVGSTGICFLCLPAVLGKGGRDGVGKVNTLPENGLKRLVMMAIRTDAGL